MSSRTSSGPLARTLAFTAAALGLAACGDFVLVEGNGVLARNACVAPGTTRHVNFRFSCPVDSDPNDGNQCTFIMFAQTPSVAFLVTNDNSGIITFSMNEGDPALRFTWPVQVNNTGTTKITGSQDGRVQDFGMLTAVGGC